ncbi:MAG: HAMP domain-containing histidine kinase [Cyclobacteriaceae bacterium]|nr:HAMP domain-containing histidine kinase [Cyclobacteriaceae bacterium HetDA_MAG_MS6]
MRKRKHLAIVWLGTLAIGLLSWLAHSVYLKPVDSVQKRLDYHIRLHQEVLERLSERVENDLPLEVEDLLVDPVVAYDNGRLFFWNTNLPTPSYSELRNSDTIFLYNEANKYLVQKKVLVFGTSRKVELFTFLPIYMQYRLQNQYLQPGYNEVVFGKVKAELSSDGEPLYFQGHHLFSIAINDKPTGWLFHFILFVALVYTIYFAISEISQLSVCRRDRGRFLSLVFFVMLFAKVGLYYGVSQPLSDFFLFDPIIFTFGVLSNSLGDFLIDQAMLLVFAILLLRNSAKLRLTRLIVSRSIASYMFGILVATLSLLNAYLVYETISVLIHNSQISLDISESISFGLVRSITYLSPVLGGIIYFCFNHVFYKLLGKLCPHVLSRWLIIAAGTLLFGIVIRGHALYIIAIQLSCWAVLDLTGLSFQYFRVRFTTFLYLILIASTASVLSSLAIYKEFESRDKQNKLRFSNEVFIKNDVLGELFLSEILLEIKKDPYVRTRFMSRLLANQNVKEKILRQYFNSYFDKYDIRVYQFGKDGQPILLTETKTLQEYESEFKLEELRTDFDNIYFKEGNEASRNKYVCFVAVENFEVVMGHIVIELALKKYIPKSVFPSLLVESSGGRSKSYDYAVYQNDNLVYTEGKYAFEGNVDQSLLARLRTRKGGMELGDKHLLGIDADFGQFLVIASDRYEFKSVVANFSFLFLLSLLSIGVIYQMLRYFDKRHQFSLANKIQFYVGVSFFIPMLVVSIALLNLLNNSYRDEINRSYQKRARNVAENVTTDTELFLSNRINRDEYANKITEIATFLQVDLNVYSDQGFLITSSQPEIFNKELLSKYINPKALSFIKGHEDEGIVLEESIGKLNYKSSFTGIRSFETGKLLAIISMPFFDSKNHLNRQQIAVFNNLAIVFTMIFLLSVIAGNAALKSLTNPIRLISDRLRKTNLQEENQPIDYDAEDEIGGLVKEYNHMVAKLEESKEALVKSQKETAWKEIARQVAHEIKNPLTPMRLKIQQMQRSIERSSPQYKSLHSLITQIDTLSAIADSFSEFAKMPIPENEVFDFSELVADISGLYQNENVSIEAKVEPGIEVCADPKMLGRILNNLILNGVQAVDDQKPSIKISLRKRGTKVLLTVQDNGAGIPEGLREKVFTPYFSTKEMGSGIGLAIAKKGIEQANGNIWFESEMGEGTSFYISLPTPS